MTKLKAALIHIGLSIFAIGLLFLTIIYIWYPKPFFEISGVIEPLKLLLMVDVIIGPLLTFVVYKKGKKYLKLDLTLIALMQIAALGYGVYTIYQGRPSMLVFNNGQFNYLSETYANNQDLIFDELKPHLFSKPKIAYVNFNGDLYNAYAQFVPMDNYDLMLLPFSWSLENMKAKFKSKQLEIEQLEQKHKDEDIVFFKLDKDMSLNYVVYSVKQNTIVDHLKF